MSSQEIIQEIESHLTKSPKQYYNDFYIGITNDIDRRLFGEHNVPKQGYWRIHRSAKNDVYARNAEKYFLDKGMQGGIGGGGSDCTWGYCYEISNQIVE